MIKKLQNLSDGKKKALIITIAVIAALAMGSVWLVWIKDRLGTTNDFLQALNLPAIELPELPVDAIVTNLGNSDWKTYANTKYGFEIRYPEEVIVKENENTIGFYYTITEFNKTQLPSENFGWDIVGYQNNDKKDLKNWFSSTFTKDIDKDCKADVFDSNIKVTGTETIVFGTGKGMDSSETCKDSGYYTISPDKSTVIKWELLQDPEYFDIMLPTFKFTNTNNQ